MILILHTVIAKLPEYISVFTTARFLEEYLLFSKLLQKLVRLAK
jgi:hypothetical protein